VGDELPKRQAFLHIDAVKIGQQGWKLIGAIEALNAAEMTVKSIREKSTVVQERVFLAEIADLLNQLAGEHQDTLVKLAMDTGAGEIREVTKGAKPH
jgi:hypothetical protein